MILASVGDEIPIMMIVFPFVFAVLVLFTWSKHKQERFKLIQRALEAGNLDEVTRKQLVENLSGSGWMATLQQQLSFLARNVVFVVGWVGIFTGLGLAGWGGIDGTEELLGMGLLVSLISFGVVTIPLALREVQGRRRA